MNPKYEKLFKPLRFPSGAEVKNRILMAPMTTQSSFENGMVTNDEVNYYAERSRGVGAVITACAYVAKEGKAFPGGFSAASDNMIPGLSKLAKAIKDRGAKAILQIFHGGRMVPKKIIGGEQPVSASAIKAPRDTADMPREMSKAEILDAVAAFGEATRRAIEAGFDGIELHGANTYLIQQFFSPHSNRRIDEWGGDVEKRMTFPLAVVAAVQEAVDKHATEPFIVGYRISPEEIEEPGITMEDTLQLAARLAEANLDYLHLSVGTVWRGSIRDKDNTTPLLERVRDHLNHKIPLVGVGSIQHPDHALDALDQGIELVSVGRELIIDPQWVEKIQDGKEAEIKQSMSLQDQERLAVPAPLWESITSVRGWFPIDEHKGS